MDVTRQVFFPTDIRNALRAAEQAVNTTADVADNKDDLFTAGFLTGYRAALSTFALAFGLVACSELALVERKLIWNRREPVDSNLFSEITG
jgi:hypothetical protein